MYRTGLAVTTNRVDGTAAGQSLIGIVPPRATLAELNHQYVEGSTEPVITTTGGRNSDLRADRTTRR